MVSVRRNEPTDHPAEHGIEFDVVLATRLTRARHDLRPFRPFAARRAIPAGTKRGSKITDRQGPAIIIFHRFFVSWALPKRKLGPYGLG